MVPGEALEEYRRKRDFERSPEPSGEPDPEDGEASTRGPRFVVQKHAATRLHYDFRLEADGVLKSWAVPKGPSLDPSDRRLAVQVEDHPLEYGSFEGIIPEGQYGGGTVLLWDDGVWEPRGDPLEGLRRGKVSFELRGEKLAGDWTLVRMRGEAGEGGKNWLLVKEDDAAAEPGSGAAIVEERPESVASGRTLDEVAEDRARVWDSSEGEVEPAPDADAGPPDADALLELEGARRGSLPERPAPQLATLVREVPEGDDWLHEIKFDGYRLVARAEEGRVRLLTRSGKDWSDRFPEVRSAVAERVGDVSALLDGEVVVLLPDGTTSFQALQEALGTGRDHDRAYYAFDLLHWDGVDLGEVALHRRKEALARLTGGATSGTLRYSDHVRGRGPDFFGNACRIALEGVVSKRRDAPYRPGRGRDWRKAKCVERQEFVVVGWSEPSGARHGFGALLLGIHDDSGALVSAGRVGTGFTDADLTRLSKTLREMEIDRPPVADPPGGSAARGVHWVLPELVVEVEFTDWTRDGSLRHPSFQGVREDRDPEEVVMETARDGGDGGGTGSPGGGAGSGSSPGGRKSPGGARTASRGDAGPEGDPTVLGVRISSPDRVLWPEQGVTKLQLARYYEEVAEWMIPHVADRPLSLVRCPRGTEEPCFFQKHPGDALPDSVGRVEIPEKDGETGVYVYVDRPEALVALVQIGTLEIHTWGARRDRVERPDRIVVDLDPGPGVAWKRVVEAALEVRDRLGDLGLESVPKTTGGKGLHVEVPVVRRHEWDEVKAFARALADAMAADRPERYTATSSKAKRKGKIYVDYLRNGRGSTYIAPYSTRAREGAPVAVPLRWDEVVPGLRPERYRTDTVFRRLRTLDEDPWSTVDGLRQSVTRDARVALGIEA